MFANRYTAFIDACTLAGTLKRNLLLTLSEAEQIHLAGLLRANGLGLIIKLVD
ncbi:hypothetical protein [Sphingomonas sp. 22176]|uniref:hypothetical protein n=1 Tax=Sphingomonas sp. 22176 TaxID=3453884 RepID=UPI003F8299CD